ncbi:hypothetical protein BX666DRAFT_1944500 [Dichotomocladium elegans]|nr:hypothetical protein BX666DRAFT_1944500 [Dichotomocladium elegans]
MTFAVRNQDNPLPQSFSSTEIVVDDQHLSCGEPPARAQAWVHSRTMSVPDIHKLRHEWELYQKSANGPNPISPGKLQIDLLNIRTNVPYKRPFMRIKMGSAQYFSSISRRSTGDWNEGFVFVVTYHAQLFDTIDLDLYDKRSKQLFAKTKHVGKAKLKLSKLKGRDDIFITFLPIYEYQPSRSLPEDVRDTIVETNLFDLAKASGRILHKKLIGSVQVRIRYHFQEPGDVYVFDPTTQRGYTYNRASSDDTIDEQSYLLQMPPTRRVSSRPDIEYPLSTSRSNEEDDGQTLTVPPPSQNRKASFAHDGLNAMSQHGRGELAQDQNVVDDAFRDRLTRIMSTHVPGSDDSLMQTDQTTRRRLRTSAEEELVMNRHQPENIWDRLNKILCFGYRQPSSSQGQRYGFSQNDSDHKFWNRRSKEIKEEDLFQRQRHRRDRVKMVASRRARHIIYSVNFGDKDFAAKWMHDNFDDVAISHPAFDRLVSLVVSRQTRALVRSVIKLANAFGQGFKVTSLRLLKGIIILERYFRALPKPKPGPLLNESLLIDTGCHYFAYALMAYGWRGLFYLGSYGEFIRQARHRRSNKYAIIRYLGIHSEDLLGYEYGLRKGAVFQPSYFVAVNRRRRAIVLSIRGTWSLYDAITDLVCEYKPFKGGLVHAGMLASAQWFYMNIVPQIFRYIHHHPDELSSFIITGHSLGGGAASLLTMLVADHHEELRELSKNPNFELHCYSYAPVALASCELNQKYDDYIHSFIVQDDIVGRLSYGTAMQLKELVMDAISTYETLGGFYKVLSDPDVRKVCFKILDQRRERIYHNTDQLYPLLYIPGKIVYICRKKEPRFTKNDRPSRTSTAVSWRAISFRRRLGKKAKSRAKQVSKKLPGATRNCYTAHRGSQTISSEMIVTKRCIEDHMLASYQEAFNQLRASMGQP